MRSLVGIVLAGFVGAAAADDGNDYSARVFYSLDFGSQGQVQSMGLRFDNELAAERGAPALFQARFDGGSSLPVLSLQGVDVAGPAMAAGQSEGGGMFSGLTTAQWIGIAFTGLVFGTIVVEAADSSDTTVSGTGAN